VPNNMAITISGDIAIAETMEIIDRKFSGWERKDIPKLRTWEEDPLNGVERVETKYQGEPYVMLAFRTAPHNHEDAEALTLVDMILDNRTAGLINLNLTQKQAVRRAGSSPMVGNDFGFQYLWGIPKKDQTLEEVEKLLLDQIEIIKKGEYSKFYMHRIGHWLGMDVHDVGNYKKNGQWRDLEPGMVLTIEPGIYILDSLEDVEEKWLGIGIRIEDDLLVTENGNEVLSANAPRDIQDIESLRS